MAASPLNNGSMTRDVAHPTPAPMLLTQLEQLRENVNELHLALEDHAARIAPITTPEAAATDPRTGPALADPCLSPMGEAVRDVTREVARIASRLRYLTSRVEI